VVLLLMKSMLGCSHASVRKNKNEIWLVDGKDLVLYRVVSDTKEQAIPIKDNPSMNRFMCMDKDEIDFWIEEADRE